MRCRGLSNRLLICFLLCCQNGWITAEVVAQSAGAGESFEKRATAFLEAGNLSGLGIEQRGLEPHLFTLLDEAWVEDRSLVAPLLLQAEALIRFEQREGGGWYRSMWNGWSVLAEIVDRYNQSLDGMQGVAVFTRLFREDREGLFPSGGGFPNRNNQAIFQAFLARGGNFDLEKGMDRLSEDLRDECGAGSMHPLLLTFMHFPNFLRPAQERELRRWAVEIETGEREGDKEIARWVSLGCLINLLGERSSSGPHGLKPGEIKQVEDQLMNLLRNDEISPAWRHGFAARISTTMPERMSPGLRTAIGDLSGKIFLEDTPYSSIGMTWCLWAFLGIEEESNEWKQVAIKLEEGWRHRNRFNGQSKKMGRALDPSLLTVGAMMEVACRLKDEASINWHLTNFSDTHGAFPALFVSLVGGGYHDRAEDLLQRYGQRVRFRSDHYLVGPRYSRRLFDQTPAFLQGVESVDLRDYAGLLLAATPDPEPMFTMDGKIPRRHERLVKASEPLLARSLSDETLHLFGNDLLSSIRGGQSLNEVLKKPTAHFFERAESGEPLSATDLYWLTHQHFYEAIVQLSKGEDFPAQFIWGRIVFEDHENSRDLRRHGAEAIVDMLHLWLKELILRESIDELSALLPFCRQVMETVPTQVYRSDVSKLQNALLVAHVHTDEMEAYRSWWEELREDRQEFLAKLLFDEMGLIETTGHLLNPVKEYAGARFPNPGLRAQRFLSLVSSPLVDQGYSRAQLLGYGFSRELILEKDLQSIAKQCAILAPRGGSAIREWLGWVSDQNDLETVLNEIEKTLSEPEWSHLTEAERFAVKLEKSLVLALLGRTESARELIAGLASSNIELPAVLSSYFVEVEEQVQ